MKIVYSVASFFLFLSLASAQAELKSRLDLYTKSKGPGLAITLIENGKTVSSKGYGYANRAKNTLITAKTNFNLASNSKQFTALAALLLERAGKLSPEDLVTKHIPELPEYAKDIKVKHLIYHTAGFKDYMELCSSPTPVTNKEIIAFLKQKDALLFPPGSKHEYSNTGYVVLSEVIERASGVPFYEFIQTEIFKKLGMDTSVVLRADGKEIVPNPSISYGEWPFLEPFKRSPCDNVYGDGGVISSLNDYSKWLNALTKSGFLTEDELKKVFKPGTLNDGGSTGYAYGWAIDEYNSEKIFMHSGSWLGYRSFAVYLPAKKKWLVILANYKAIPAWDLIKEYLF